MIYKIPYNVKFHIKTGETREEEQMENIHVSMPIH